MRHPALVGLLMLALVFPAAPWPIAQCQAEGDWEITPQSELALERGLEWLARNQGTEGNWTSNDLGLVGIGALAFLSAGHMPGRGKYGQTVERALDYILEHADKSTGLLNISSPQRDMYNHGLTTFVLGQAHGMTNDPRISPVLDRALKLIAATQCEDGGWDYRAHHQSRGHDLSLAVMQAKALRSAVDSGLEVAPEVTDLAIKSVRNYYRAQGGRSGMSEAELKKLPGQFTYAGGRGTIAMGAAGVVCMQEFGQYNDWRISRTMEVLQPAVLALKPRRGSGDVPFDAYTLYYVGQAVYQVGGEDWEKCYPILRDTLVENQIRDPKDPRRDGRWRDTRHVSGLPGEMYGTAVACFILAMPNRYLPILQEGKIDSLRERFQTED